MCVRQVHNSLTNIRHTSPIIHQQSSVLSWPHQKEPETMQLSPSQTEASFWIIQKVISDTAAVGRTVVSYVQRTRRVHVKRTDGRDTNRLTQWLLYSSLRQPQMPHRQPTMISPVTDRRKNTTIRLRYHPLCRPSFQKAATRIRSIQLCFQRGLRWIFLFLAEGGMERE